MNWLARLKKEKAPGPQAREPRQPPEREESTGFLGSLAYPPASLQKIEAREAAANDTEAEATADPDRWCWPHSAAMNGQEIDTFTERLARFTDKGASLEEAERLADKLVIRDREGDDRRLCLECAHLKGQNPWGCGNGRQAGVCDAALARDLVLMLQRCEGFKDKKP